MPLFEVFPVILFFIVFMFVAITVITGIVRTIKSVSSQQAAPPPRGPARPGTRPPQPRRHASAPYSQRPMPGDRPLPSRTLQTYSQSGSHLCEDPESHFGRGAEDDVDMMKTIDRYRRERLQYRTFERGLTQEEREHFEQTYRELYESGIMDAKEYRYKMEELRCR